MRVRRRGGGKLLVSDWVSQPSTLWRRCRLWKISSHEKIALAGSTRWPIACGRAIRSCIRPQNASMTALSASPKVSIGPITGRNSGSRTSRWRYGAPPDACPPNEWVHSVWAPCSWRCPKLETASSTIPTASAGSSRKAPVAHDGRRGRGGQVVPPTPSRPGCHGLGSGLRGACVSEPVRVEVCLCDPW
jgi:hypothetical protein